MKNPFAKLIFPAAVGVVVARFVDIPPLVAAGCAAAVFVLTAINRREIYVYSLVFLSFFAASMALKPHSEIPQGDKLILVGQVEQMPSTRGRWQSTTARVGYWRSQEGGGWHRVDERLQLNVDTCYRISMGDQIGFRAWVNPIDSGSYGRLMALRGIFSRAYLTQGNLVREAPHRSRTFGYFAAGVQAKAVERLRRLNLEPTMRGIVEAMAVGWRGDLDREERAKYSATGAAHLLAVSGLHVGIVFVLINLLLWPLAIGKWRSGIAVAAIWSYAVTAGLAPSVVRAALMFTFAQIALASGERRSGMNIMAGSAVVMLALNPNLWGDASFMLSYAAVFSIIAFFNPAYRHLKTRFWGLNILISIVIVGFLASIGTAPLVVYWFGNLPLVGMVLNPIVIVTAHVIVAFGVLWMVVPAGFLKPVFSTIINTAARVQNATVEWGAQRQWAAVRVGEIPLWAVLAAYLVLILAAIYVEKRDRNPIGTA